MKIILLEQKQEEKEGKVQVVAEEKTYAIPFVPSSAFLEYLEIEEEIEDLNNLKPSEIKKLVSLIVKTYGNQFTEEEFYKGVPSYLLMGSIVKFIDSLNTDPYADKKQSVKGNDEGNSGKKAD